MTWFPISFAPTQYVNSSGVPYSGAVLKAYSAGTTTPILMATSYTGVTTAGSVALNASGYPAYSGNVIIPHLEENYKLALYPTQAAADANSGALWTVDDIQVTDTTIGITSAQGMLTLSSTLPVMRADTTAATTLYYLPYIGQIVPVFSGAKFINWTLGSAGLSLALDSNSGHTGYHQSTKLFDVFSFLNSGALTLGTGPAWTSDTARADAIFQKEGLWVNSALITLRFGSGSGNTVAVASQQAICLGTIYATANGQTGMSFRPAFASGGSGNVLGVYNAYNRLRRNSLGGDSTASWTYATPTWRAANNSNANRITYVDGLGQSAVEGSYHTTFFTSLTSTNAQVGVMRDATNAASGFAAYTSNDNATAAVASDIFLPSLGLHYVQAVEYSSTTTSTYLGNSNGGIIKVSLEM